MAYDKSWDRPHVPTDDSLWQESDCYWFYDRDAGIGGYHRIGQEPNNATGQVLMFAYKENGQRFKLVYEESDSGRLARTETGQRVGSSVVESLEAGRVNFQWNETDCAADLEFYDQFYEPRSWMKNEDTDEDAAEVKKKMNDGGHLEVAGRIKGTLRLGTETYSISALAHRDRSWGVRNIESAYQHRMVTGTVGPELSWATFIMHLSNGHVAKAGYVAIQGETFDITDLNVFTEFDYDGLTVPAVRTRLTLENGQSVDINGDATQGFTVLTKGWLLSSHHFIEVEQNGVPGFTILDTTNRPSRGDFVPSQQEVSRICMDQGLSSAADYRSLR